MSPPQISPAGQGLRTQAAFSLNLEKPKCQPPSVLGMQGAIPSMHLRLIRSLLTFLHEIINFDIAEDISLWPRSQRAVCGLLVSGLYSAHRFDEWDWKSLGGGGVTERMKERGSCFSCRNTGWCCIGCKAGEQACRAPGSKSQKRASENRGMGLSGSPLRIPHNLFKHKPLVPPT